MRPPTFQRGWHATTPWRFDAPIAPVPWHIAPLFAAMAKQMRSRAAETSPSRAKRDTVSG